jgi:hypothetical protein
VRHRRFVYRGSLSDFERHYLFTDFARATGAVARQWGRMELTGLDHSFRRSAPLGLARTPT